MQSDDRRISTVESAPWKATILSNPRQDNMLNAEDLMDTVDPLDKQPIIYRAPEITKQPKRYRRVRMMRDVARKNCSLVQAGEHHEQRKYMEIEVIISLSWSVES